MTSPTDQLLRLETTIADRLKSGDATHSYVASLAAQGRGKIAQKLGEEAVETVIAAMRDDPSALTSEAADLVFHLTVLLNHAGICWDAVLAELARRDGTSGLIEKSDRDGTSGLIEKAARTP